MIEPIGPDASRGTSIAPEVEASTPRTNWNSSGSRNVAPSIAAEHIAAIATPHISTEFANSRGGSSGSIAMHSRHASPASSTNTPKPSVTTCHESQSYSVPPQLITSRKQVTSAVSSAAPA